jgi:CRISPR-associated protein Cst1
LKTSGKAGLQWTYHPIIDVGIATLTAFAGRNSPEDVTFGDLEKFAEYAEGVYFTPLLESYLSVLFTKNFYPINPSLKSKKDKAKKVLGGLLRSYRIHSESSMPLCAYCNRPSIKLPIPKTDFAYRDLVPMLTGRGIANFFPLGRSGLPLCGLCVVAIQAIAIGAPMISGRALIVSSDDPFLTLALIKKWLPETRARIQLAEASGQKPPNIGRPLTRVIEAFASLDRQRANWGEDIGITVFHLSNSGQGPDVDIYELPSNITRFVIRAQTVKYHSMWTDMVQSAWEKFETQGSAEDIEAKKRSKKSKAKTKNRSSNQFERRNYLFEDLFKLPEETGRFIRTYFLRQPPQFKQQVDPRTHYKGWQDARYIKWDLTELFLKEVMDMEKSRIEAIRKLGDRIAEEIISTNDKGFWRNIYNCQKSYDMRNLLISQSQKCIKAGKEPIIRFEPFLEIFEEGEEIVRVDWKLAWDLVLIRVIEQLYEKKWFDQNKEVLEIEEIDLIKQEV